MIIFSRRIWQERFATIRLYYNSPKFALIDLAFGLIALSINPYRTCRKFLQKKKADNIHAYGETPYTTYQRLADECGVGSQDTWIEMGAGRGKGCFWLSHFIGCKVIGIEWIPQFIAIARAIKVLFGIKQLEFRQSDIEQADLSQGTVIYLYGLWPEMRIGSGVKVITISEPLRGYTVLKSFWVRFPWGRTTAYVQIRST